MPFTPYHFGPGALIKSIIPKRFSFLIFIAVQILIDCEPLYFIMTKQYPVHRILHTYLGCHLVILASLVLVRPVLQWTMQKFFSLQQALISAMIGAYSHVFLDSLMHADMKPFYPFLNSNFALNLIDVRDLNEICVSVGVLGVTIYLLISIFKKIMSAKKR